MFTVDSQVGRTCVCDVHFCVTCILFPVKLLKAPPSTRTVEVFTVDWQVGLGAAQAGRHGHEHCMRRGRILLSQAESLP